MNFEDLVSKNVKYLNYFHIGYILRDNLDILN